MNYFAIVSLFNGIVALLAAIYVLLRDRRNPLYVSFALFAFGVALWAIFYSLWQSQTAKPEAFFFMRLLMVPCYTLPFSFLWFTLTLLEIEARKRLWPWLLAAPFVFLPFSFSELMVKDVREKLIFAFWPDPGFLVHPFVASFFGIVLYCFFLLFTAWSRASGTRRWQLKWVTLTTLLAWIGGSTNWFLWYDIPIVPFPNVFVGVFFLLLAVAIIRRNLFDIDALADLVQEAKVSALSTLAASVLHEIRSPLFAARGFAESLIGNMSDGLFKGLSSEERDKQIQNQTEKIVGQINRTLEIAKRFSDFTKPYGGPGQSENVPVKEVVDNVLSLIGHELEVERIRIEKELRPETQIRVDRRHLEEILINLITNAYQAMPEGGVLQISEERIDGRVGIKIRDSGKGIPPDKLKRIFDPFFSMRGEKGTGLGLYIVKKLIDRNGGKIKVTSHIGKGTTFSLEFPVVAMKTIRS